MWRILSGIAKPLVLAEREPVPSTFTAPDSIPTVPISSIRPPSSIPRDADHLHHRHRRAISSIRAPSSLSRDADLPLRPPKLCHTINLPSTPAFSPFSLYNPAPTRSVLYHFYYTTSPVRSPDKQSPAHSTSRAVHRNLFALSCFRDQISTSTA